MEGVGGMTCMIPLIESTQDFHEKADNERQKWFALEWQLADALEGQKRAEQTARQAEAKKVAL